MGGTREPEAAPSRRPHACPCATGTGQNSAEQGSLPVSELGYKERRPAELRCRGGRGGLGTLWPAVAFLAVWAHQGQHQWVAHNQLAARGGESGSKPARLRPSPGPLQSTPTLPPRPATRRLWYQFRRHRSSPSEPCLPRGARSAGLAHCAPSRPPAVCTAALNRSWPCHHGTLRRATRWRR